MPCVACCPRRTIGEGDEGRLVDEKSMVAVVADAFLSESDSVNQLLAASSRKPPPILPPLLRPHSSPTASLHSLSTSSLKPLNTSVLRLAISLPFSVLIRS